VPCDNSRTLIKGFVRRSRILTTLLVLALCCAHAQAQEAHGKPIAIIGIASEVAPVEARIAGPMVTRIQGFVFTSGTIDGTPVVAARSGVGKVNAALAATLLLEHFTPSAVVFTGTAGAIDPDLMPADVVIGTSTGYHDFGDTTDKGFIRSPTRDPVSGKLDPPFFPADPKLLAAAQRAARTVKPARGPRLDGAPPQIREGLIVTGDAFIANAVNRAVLRRDLKATAAEMEGAAVMQICSRFGVPGIVIRGITDRADNQAEDSYRRFVETASRNAADLAVATAREFAK
jgi:adenosylhomocysteine nucleosidase